MTYTLRTLHLFALVFLVGIWLSGCEDAATGGGAQNVPPGGKCAVEKDCVPGNTCVDEICVAKDTVNNGNNDNNGDTDAGLEDTGSDTGEGDDVEDDSDTGPVEPECEVEVSCAAEGMECGQIPNGCGGIKSCGTCAQNQYCGEGLDHGKCIAIACEPGGQELCAEQGVQCGAISDGCGGSIDCGTCSGDTVCGNGPTRGQCIVPEACVPKTTCEGTRFECGPMPDGCGGFVQCGGCAVGESCNAGMCEPPVCQPKTAADFPHVECGVVADGCGGFVNLNKTCGAGKVCGTGAERGKCVDPVCIPLTAQDYQGIANCGAVSDGCNGTIELGNPCQAPEICGGSGVANRCGADNRGPDCEGLCQHQAVCPGAGATILRGTVYAPNGTLPVPNVTLYVPNMPLNQLPPIDDSGATCLRCEDEDLGKVLVGAVSDKSGNFELRHVPAGVEFPLVIKTGKWRRVVMIPAQNACGTSVLPAHLTSLPKTQGGATGHDNIPKTAISTGSVDAIECVLRKLGVADSEFTQHTQNGRVHIYRGNGGFAPGVSGCSSCTDGNPSANACTTNNNYCRNQLATNLFSNAARLDSYDMVVSDCEANANRSWRSNTDRTNVLNYVNKGGRFFASHFGYIWLDQTDGLKESATWGGGSSPGSTLAYVDESTQRGQDFSYWLGVVGAKYHVNGAGGQSQVSISEPRNYVQSVHGKSVPWVHTVQGASGHQGNTSVQQYTFNTPFNAAPAAECGRVVYSAFHVNGSSPNNRNFPAYCSTGDLTAQEKILAYMLFDLGQCLSEDGGPPPVPVCNPRSCEDIGAVCGAAGDGCGGVIQCGTCPDGQACGVGAPPNQCGGVCRPISCEEHGANCGVIQDGCGGTLNCGTCPSGQSCGAGGEVNVCGCEPLSCDDHGAQCGTVSDGCGGTLECGTCGPGQACQQVGGVNQCVGDCDPLSCEDHGVSCGTVANGCGGTMNCGSCAAPETCGGGGVIGECGVKCEPLSCEDHGAQCGPVSDGCGGTLDCGGCPELEVCDNMQCVMPACKPAGNSCIDSRQCCSGVCAMGSGASEGVCIST